MGIFWRSPFQWLRVETYPDTFGVDRAAVWSGIKAAVERQRRVDDLVLLVAHFPATYFELQDQLASWQVEETLVRSPLRAVDLPLRSESSAINQGSIEPGSAVMSPVVLVLAEMLDPERPIGAMDRRRSVSMMVCERHPLARHDQRIEAFAQGLPQRTRLGFFVSLDDDGVGPFLGEWTAMLLQQFGMQKNDLISSDLVSRRLRRSQQRLNREIQHEQPCESSREWIEKHLTSGRYAAEVQRWLARKAKIK